MTLALDQVVLVRGTNVVLNGVSMHLAPGEVVGLLGANGAGKSSLLGVLAGDLSVRSGAVTLGGQALSTLPFAHQARRRAVLAQQAGLQFDLRVDEVVAMGGYPFPELSAAEVAGLVREALALTGMHALTCRRYLDLSGGEQQRVHYARALVQCRAASQPGVSRFLLLDEPTANQDPAHQQQVLRIAVRMAHDEGLGVLAVLHDINLAARWCDRILLLAEGAIIGEGSAEQALTPERLQRVYGVDTVVVPHPLHPGRLMVMMR